MHLPSWHRPRKEFRDPRSILMRREQITQTAHAKRRGCSVEAETTAAAFFPAHVAPGHFATVPGGDVLAEPPSASINQIDEAALRA